MSQQGLLFVIAAPSGAGKTSLVNALVKQVQGLRISVSYTTRAPRPDDQEGVDYHFVSKDKFLSMVSEGAFLEYAEVFGNYYGTANHWVLERLNAGEDVILEIDWQGAEQIKHLFPKAQLIFILPPSLAALQQRLEYRKQDSQEVIQERFAKARNEIAHYTEFHYMVVNDQFDRALQDLVCIVTAQRLSLERQLRECKALLSDLLAME